MSFSDARILSRSPVGSSVGKEVRGIAGLHLTSHPGGHSLPADPDQVAVEIVEPRVERPDIDPDRRRSLGNRPERRKARRVPVARNVKAAKRCRKFERREMGRRKPCDERKCRGDFAQREHGFDTLAKRHHLIRQSETHAMP